VSFADSLPEDAADYKKVPALDIERCLCDWRWVSDPLDVPYATVFSRYPRSYPLITFSANCLIAEHRAKAGTQRHFNHWVTKD
jgi:hypothetical protein